MSDLFMIELPRGGRAWARTRLGHGRAKIVDKARRRSIPLDAIKTLRDAQAAQAHDGGEDDGNRLLKLVTPELMEAADLLVPYQEAVIRETIHHWQGVLDPDTEEELAFPDGLEHVDEDDFDALYRGAEKALTQGRADPNAGRGISGDSSLPASPSPTTSQTTSPTPG